MPVADNMDERFDQETKDSDIAEGTAFKVAPTMGYNVQLELREQRIGDDAKRPWEFERAITSFKAPIVVMTEDEREIKIGSAILDVSHEMKRDDKTGDMDKLAKRYTQLVKALQDIEALPKTGVKSSAVWAAAAEYPIHIFVTETFKVPGAVLNRDSEWAYDTVRRPDDLEKIKGYKDEGWVPKNYIQSVSKFRQES